MSHLIFQKKNTFYLLWKLILMLAHFPCNLVKLDYLTNFQPPWIVENMFCMYNCFLFYLVHIKYANYVYIQLTKPLVNRIFTQSKALCISLKYPLKKFLNKIRHIYNGSSRTFYSAYPNPSCMSASQNTSLTASIRLMMRRIIV